MNPISGKVTLGHFLFTRWAIQYGGAQELNPIRPTGQCLEKIRLEMNKRRNGVHRYKHIKTIHGMWYWLYGSSKPCRPRVPYRVVLRRMTDNEVPSSSWELELTEEMVNDFRE